MKSSPDFQKLYFGVHESGEGGVHLMATIIKLFYFLQTQQRGFAMGSTESSRLLHRATNREIPLKPGIRASNLSGEPAIYNI